MTICVLAEGNGEQLLNYSLTYSPSGNFAFVQFRSLSFERRFDIFDSGGSESFVDNLLLNSVLYTF